MALVIAAAFFMSTLFIVFKVFERRGIALLPAIVINYMTATACGLALSGTWQAADLGPLMLPALVLGVLFIAIFLLTGESTQQAGVAATTVASKMSLVLVVVFAVIRFGERPGVLGWLGIAGAVAAVILSSWSRGAEAARGVWKLPLLLFLGNAVIDIGINWVQRERLDPDTERVFPAMLFAVAGGMGLLWLLVRRRLGQLTHARTLVGGAVLGLLNYAALFHVVRALSSSGLRASSVYPLINIGVILFGALLALLLFRERPGMPRMLGMAMAIIALVLLLLDEG